MTAGGVVVAGIKIRAKIKDGTTTVKALITHPMETGRRTDPETKAVVPAHFIQRIVAEHNGKLVFESLWGTGVSANPFISFAFTGGKAGDKVKLTWVDNKGESGHTETVIK